MVQKRGPSARTDTPVHGRSTATAIAGARTGGGADTAPDGVGGRQQSPAAATRQQPDQNGDAAGESRTERTHRRVLERVARSDGGGA